MTIRWGIIGCGDVTEIKSGPGFQQARGSELVAVMRRDAERAADYARRHDVPRWYDDAQQLIDDPQVDAVYIATPVGSHLEHALRVCAAGKPCYVEKPMARSHAEAQRMVEAFAAAGLPLFVAYYRRALPRFLKARELLAAGRLGTITSISYRFHSPAHRKAYTDGLPWRVQVAQSGAGLFLDLGSHTLDILDFLLGPLHHVQGHAVNRASPYDAEDVVSMSFTAGEAGVPGVPGAACWNFAAAVSDDRIVIDGTDARLSLSTFGNEPIELHTDAGVQCFDLPNSRHVQLPLIQTLVDQLAGQGVCESTGPSGARASAVMDAALNAYYAGRDDAFWQRPQTWPGRRDLPAHSKPAQR
ncbi:MAG: Gfo/Idh/MocA family oxidoreductase [Phycisphaeraceae bacterium]